jgi:hypothetical protein
MADKSVPPKQARPQDNFVLRSCGSVHVITVEGRSHHKGIISPEGLAELGLSLPKIPTPLTASDFNRIVAWLRRNSAAVPRAEPVKRKAIEPASDRPAPKSAIFRPPTPGCPLEGKEAQNRHTQCPGHQRQGMTRCVHPFPWMKHTCLGHHKVKTQTYDTSIQGERKILQEYWAKEMDPLTYGGNVSVIHQYGVEAVSVASTRPTTRIRRTATPANRPFQPVDQNVDPKSDLANLDMYPKLPATLPAPAANQVPAKTQRPKSKPKQPVSQISNLANNNSELTDAGRHAAAVSVPPIDPGQPEDDPMGGSDFTPEEEARLLRFEGPDRSSEWADAQED